VEDENAEKEFGQRVRDYRDARGWSQEKLADLMSAAGHPWRQTTTAKTEAADRPVRVREVVALARIFGVPVGALFDVGIEADTAYQLHGIERADAELEKLEKRLQAQRSLLNFERNEIAMQEANRRWRAAQGGNGGEHRPEA